MAFVGPGVGNLGVDNTWAGETDTRPILMALVGLKDDYTHEGAVLSELLDPREFPRSLTSPQYSRLAGIYTALESPVGPFGLATLTLSTRAVASGSAQDDSLYQRTNTLLVNLGTQRNALGATMIGLLEGAAFSGEAIPPPEAASFTVQGDALLRQVQQVADML